MYQLIKDQKTGEDSCISRIADQACIPFDPSNTDYQQFLQHLAQGLPVEAVDGTAMTESEIAALYQTLAQPNT